MTASEPACIPIVLGLLFAFMARPAHGAERVVSLNLCTDPWLVLQPTEQVAGVSPLARDPAPSFVAEQAARLPMVRASAQAVIDLRPDLILGARFGAQATLVRWSGPGCG